MKFRAGDYVIHHHNNPEWDGVFCRLIEESVYSGNLFYVEVIDLIFPNGDVIPDRFRKKEGDNCSLQINCFTLVCGTCRRDDCVTLRSE